MARSGHLEREAKLNLGGGLLYFIGIPLSAALLGAFIFQRIDTLRADRCLDQGGRYDYDTAQCQVGDDPLSGPTIVRREEPVVARVPRVTRHCETQKNACYAQCCALFKASACYSTCDAVAAETRLRNSEESNRL